MRLSKTVVLLETQDPNVETHGTEMNHKPSSYIAKLQNRQVKVVTLGFGAEARLQGDATYVTRLLLRAFPL